MTLVHGNVALRLFLSTTTPFLTAVHLLFIAVAVLAEHSVAAAVAASSVAAAVACSVVVVAAVAVVVAVLAVVAAQAVAVAESFTAVAVAVELLSATVVELSSVAEATVAERLQLVDLVVLHTRQSADAFGFQTLFLSRFLIQLSLIHI